VSNPLSDIQKLDIIRQLQVNHRNGVAIESEFTIGKFDFLLDKGYVLIPPGKRETYMNEAKSDYQYELNDMVHTSDLIDGHTASQALIRCAKGEYSFSQMQYISNKVKIIALKDFLLNNDI